MLTGRFGYAPHRTSMSRDSLCESILRDLLEGMGKPYDTRENTWLFIQCNTYARALSEAWVLYFRMLNQINPLTMTDFLEGWEHIFNIKPSAQQSEKNRRKEIALHFLFSKSGASIYTLNQFFKIILPNTFVRVELIPSTKANTHVPLGANVPGGINVPPDGFWSSSISHILIVTQKPATMTENEFYAEVGRLYAYAHLILPAWATFDWVREGASGVGFYLDEEHNLDNQRFD